VDVRLIAATNRDLLSLIKEGRFREDLFYRVNVFPIIIPPLRDRVDDIPLLAKHFLDKFNFQTGSAVKKIDSTALDIMTRYNWPGNVRELENEIERAHILTGDETNISVRCLSQRITQFLEKIVDEKSKNESLKLKEAIDQLEKSMIVAALQSCDGNRTLTAKRLGLSRQGLINKIYKYGLTSL
jgi:Nif-specific regulatory protein